MNIRKITLAFAALAFAALVAPTVASANFAIHGNYVKDTDACAGCHRAHTSVSSLTWTDAAGGENSALLISTATKMQDFCYACHDGNSLGADTNVQDGIYLGTENGTPGGVLNGGGFDSLGAAPVTSNHVINGADWGAYGGGYFGKSATDPTTNGEQGVDPVTGKIRNVGFSTNIKMDCATCHDPHGSPNYRILKSKVNGNYVGGYTTVGAPSADDPNPDGYVSSVETGWPAGGFRLHTAYPAYKPNYTEPRYARGYDMTAAAVGTLREDTEKGMSGWCAGCHSVYNLPKTDLTKADGTPYRSSASTYNAGDTIDLNLPVGGLRRHRHPMNVPLSNYDGPDASSMTTVTNPLPLAHSLDESSTGPVQGAGDWVECLTCHRAHGTAATMSGWADELSQATGDEVPDFISRNSGSGGSGAQEPSALLRGNNRYVCEACHNK